MCSYDHTAVGAYSSMCIQQQMHTAVGARSEVRRVVKEGRAVCGERGGVLNIPLNLAQKLQSLHWGHFIGVCRP